MTTGTSCALFRWYAFGIEDAMDLKKEFVWFLEDIVDWYNEAPGKRLLLMVITMALLVIAWFLAPELWAALLVVIVVFVVGLAITWLMI